MTMVMQAGGGLISGILHQRLKSEWPQGFLYLYLVGAACTRWKIGNSFVKSVSCEVAITRSAVLAQNAPQTA